MPEVQPQIPEQPQTQIQAQPQVQPQPKKNGFSGKQVIGIVFGVLLLLAVGLAIGGAIGYRLGTADGAQQALANLPAAPAPRDRSATSTQFRNTLWASATRDQSRRAVSGRDLPDDYAGDCRAGRHHRHDRRAGARGDSRWSGRQAGLKPGDVVIAVDGQPVDEDNDLRARVATFKPNDEVTLTIVKGTANGPIDQRDVKVKLGERPAEQSFNFEMPFELDENGMPKLPFGDNGLPTLPDVIPSTGGAYLGVEYELITPDVAARESITGTQGAFVKTVLADSPAAQAGLKAGDVISAVDGKSIGETNNLRDVVLGHQPGDEITLTIVKGTAKGPAIRVGESHLGRASRPAAIPNAARLPTRRAPPDSREG